MKVNAKIIVTNRFICLVFTLIKKVNYRVIANTQTPSNQLAGPSNATSSEFFAPGLPVYRIPKRIPNVFTMLKPYVLYTITPTPPLTSPPPTLT